MKKLMKRRVCSILNRKIIHYTKEIIKLTSIMAIGMLIVTGITLVKFKPVYEVSLDGEEIGYIEDKLGFKNLVNELLKENDELNIAFVDMQDLPKYELKFVQKHEQINDDNVFLAVKDKAEITYYRYAINVDDATIQYVNTQEEADTVKQAIKEQYSDMKVDVIKTYTKNSEEITSIEIASISDVVIQKIKDNKKEEQKIQQSTLNGVYLAVNPIKGNITSRYGSRESIRDHAHKGLDIAASTGTKIKAVADGTVTFAATSGAYGNLIKINHGNGVETYYGHCSKINVKKGQTVKAGEIIGAVGSTGRSTGPHLHLEVRLNGSILNPLNYLYK